VRRVQVVSTGTFTIGPTPRPRIICAYNCSGNGVCAAQTYTGPFGNLSASQPHCECAPGWRGQHCETAGSDPSTLKITSIALYLALVSVFLIACGLGVSTCVRRRCRRRQDERTQRDVNADLEAQLRSTARRNSPRAVSPELVPLELIVYKPTCGGPASLRQVRRCESCITGNKAASRMSGDLRRDQR
jgi:hypothetical protein